MSLSINENYLRNYNYSVAMIVTNTVLGDSRVLKTAQSLSCRGYHVHLLGLNKKNRKDELKGFPFRVTLVPNPAAEMRKEGLFYNQHNEQNFELFIKRLARAYIDTLNGAKYDYLHTHDMTGLPIGFRVRNEGAAGKIGWIHDVHEYMEGCTHIPEEKRRYYLEQEEIYIKEPDALLTVSPILSDLLYKKYKISKPSIILNTPRKTDFDSFYNRPIRSALGIPKDAILLVYSGNVTPARGLHIAVNGLAMLPDIHMALLTNSKSNYLDQLHEIVKRHEAQERFYVYKYVPFNHVTSFLSGANIGIHPITEYGNANLALPTKLFEYLHAGAPVVSTANQAMSKFIVDNKCGTTHKAEDPTGFAEAVKKCLSQFPKGLSNVAEGSFLASTYCWEEQENEIFLCYDDLRTQSNNKLPSKILTSGHALHLMVHKNNQAKRIAGYLAGNKSEVIDYEIGLSLSYHYDIYHFYIDYFSLKGLGQLVEFSFLILLLKSMGKKLFVHVTFYGEKKHNNDYNDVFNIVSMVSDYTFVNNPADLFYLHNALVLPIGVNVGDLPDIEKKDQKIKIVYVLKGRESKTVQSVNQSFHSLQTEGYPFDFEIVEMASHKDLVLSCKSATIIIDNLTADWYGPLAIEGMALGKVVIANIHNDLRHYLPSPSPVIQANLHNIEKVLRYILQNPNMIETYSKIGYEYVKKNHNLRVIAETMKQIYIKPLDKLDPILTASYISKQITGILGNHENDFGNNGSSKNSSSNNDSKDSFCIKRNFFQRITKKYKRIKTIAKKKGLKGAIIKTALYMKKNLKNY